MSKTPEHILMKLADANQAGIDMDSPKAVVTFLLAQGEKESILFFYKPNSVEFDFDKYKAAVTEMNDCKN
ncbi:hypothetical protein QL992_02280 [Microbacterium sp. APC 3898]|uniref:Uncharacterized protein n=2 Tax=Planococcus TaxID=1372 RepID=A0ABT7ZI22_9BACL|nr:MULTISPECIES: hypothetical protein [Terrabacteria group]MBD8014087.1 hypothetical protein [Planococcus wigleyi]MDN3426327.1 hypothetical protein [Planococcus sp. APC 4016]MDN3438832.1 hypothetical protein [Planococcus sp. APC 3900]MDN3498023.1 hypothetical protein [Microbacterium sp. APC 3898]